MSKKLPFHFRVFTHGLLLHSTAVSYSNVKDEFATSASMHSECSVILRFIFCVIGLAGDWQTRKSDEHRDKALLAPIDWLHRMGSVSCGRTLCQTECDRDEKKKKRKLRLTEAEKTT